jgi:hypothetical protein
MVEGCGGTKLLTHFMAAQNQRIVAARRQGQDRASKDSLPVTYFLQLDPTFHISTTSQ